MEVASVFLVRNHPSKHTHHYLTNIWQEKWPSWLKAVHLCDVCFCWWHVSFSGMSACMDTLTFPLHELGCVVGVLCMLVSCLISCCFLFQVSLILLFFNQCLGPWHNRKETLFQEVPDWYCATGLVVASAPIGHLFNRGKGKAPITSSVIPKFSYCWLLSWKGGVVFFVFVFSSVTDILLMGVKEIHTGYSPWLNTPA